MERRWCSTFSASLCLESSPPRNLSLSLSIPRLGGSSLLRSISRRCYICRRWLSSAIYLSSVFDLSRFLSSRNRVVLLSLDFSRRWPLSRRRSISLSLSSTATDLSICGSPKIKRWTGCCVVYACLWLWFFVVWSKVLFVCSVDHVSRWLSWTATEHSLGGSPGIVR